MIQSGVVAGFDLALTPVALPTLEEYMALGPDVKAEVVDGRLVIAAPPGPQHGEIAGNVFGFIWSYARRHRLGLTFTAQTAYVEASDEGIKGALMPDVSFVRREKISRDRDPSRPFTFPPDLAVLVLSPSDTHQQTAAKIKTYLQRQTPLLWVVNPFDRTVSVYSPSNIVGNARAMGQILDGGDVLPNFILPVVDIFADVLSNGAHYAEEDEEAESLAAAS